MRCARLNAKLQTPNAKGLAPGSLSSFWSLEFEVWRLALSPAQRPPTANTFPEFSKPRLSPLSPKLRTSPPPRHLPNVPYSPAMSHPPTPPISTLRLLRLLLWVEWRSFLARLRGVRRESPLLIFVLGAFVLGYLLIGFVLFRAGLDYLYHFPLVGSLLSQRILFLIFGFFFVMLVFSNLIIGYSTLFKNNETQWLLTLPVAHLNVYRWKFIEALSVSSRHHTE